MLKKWRSGVSPINEVYEVAKMTLKREIERELKRERYHRAHRETGFVSLEFIHTLFAMGNPSNLRLSLQDDLNLLRRSESDIPIQPLSIERLETFVRESAPKLYALLLLMEQSVRMISIFLDDYPISDKIFGPHDTDNVNFSSLNFLESNVHLKDIARDIYEKQWYIPPVLSQSQTSHFPKKYFRFPYLSEPLMIGSGIIGHVNRVTVANGHLEADDMDQDQVS
jgi:hypothetical protein